MAYVTGTAYFVCSCRRFDSIRSEDGTVSAVNASQKTQPVRIHHHVIRVRSTAAGVGINRNIYFYEGDTLAIVERPKRVSDDYKIKQAVRISKRMIALASSQGFEIFNLKTKQWAKDLPSDLRKKDVSQLYVHEDELYIFETNGEITKTDNSLEVTGRHSIGDTVTAVTPINDHLYLAAGAKILEFDIHNVTSKLLFDLTEQYPAMGPTVSALAATKDGKLWIGTSSDGLFLWDTDAIYFQYLTENTEQSISNDEIWTVYQDPNERHLWIGSSNGLDRYDLLSNTVKQYPMLSSNKIFTPIDFLLPNSNVVHQIIGRKDNYLWLVGSRELMKVDIQTGKISTPTSNSYQERLKNGRMTFFHMDDKDRIWFAQKSQIWCFNMDESLELAAQLKESDDFIHTLFKDPKEAQGLLLSTQTELYRFDMESHALTLCIATRVKPILMRFYTLKVQFMMNTRKSIGSVI